MCTVTWLQGSEQQYFLTSNRDELVDRAASEIAEKQSVLGKKITFPRDSGAGGTWIAICEDQRAICLLNGAFERHERKLPYRKSRGQVVLEYFDHQNIDHFVSDYDLGNIEPFTLVVSEYNRLFEMSWDGSKKYLSELDPAEPHIWSSKMLYDSFTVEKREKWFAKWQRQYPDFAFKDILYFHKYAGDGDKQNDVMMNRNDVLKTISVTGLIIDKENIEMIHQDLVHQKILNVGAN